MKKDFTKKASRGCVRACVDFETPGRLGLEPSNVHSMLSVLVKWSWLSSRVNIIIIALVGAPCSLDDFFYSLSF